MRTEPSAHDIEIEDPLDFLSAKEKEAFLRMQKEKEAREEAFYDEDFDEIEDDIGDEALFVEEEGITRAGAVSPEQYEDYNAYRADLKDLMEEEEELGLAPGRLSREKKRGKAASGREEDYYEESPRKSRDAESARQGRTRGQQAKPRRETYREKAPIREKPVKEYTREKQSRERIREKTPVRERAPREVYRDKGGEEATAAQKGMDKVIVLLSRLTLIAILVVLLYIGYTVIRTVRGTQDPAGNPVTALMQGEGGEAGGDEAVTGERMVTTTDLRLRSAPDTTEGSIVTTVTKGTELIRTSEENGWSVVIYQDQTLYCATQYLEAAP